MPRGWHSRALSKQASLSAAIPEKWRLKGAEIPNVNGPRNVTQLPKRFLTGLEVAITETMPFEVLKNVQTGIWSAEDVTIAFCHRAAIAHQVVNCLTEVLFEPAIERARQLDQYKARTGGLVGPLHGLPVSFMDRFRIAGAETGAGYIGWLGKVEDSDSESLVVKQMRRLGAVPFCKTNMPMSMLLGETSNNIIGSTINPFVKGLSSGGAAGGEGVLLAMKASPFGWGTEIAGSARIPATFNGLYTLRVSSGRLSSKGVATSMEGVPLCGSVIAPMSRDLALLEHVMKSVVTSQTSYEDPSLIDLSWRINFEPEARDPFIFAILSHDTNVFPHPPIKRALNTVALALRAQGHEVIDWNPPAHDAAVSTLFQILGSDGASGIRAAMKLSGEPPVPQLEQWYFEQENGSLPTTEFWELCQRRADYLSRYQSYWSSTSAQTMSRLPVDGVIMPVTADAAAREPTGLTYFAYTAIVNFLDYSAGSFPVTKVDKGVDLRFPHTPLSDEDRKIWPKYDPEAFNGAPVGLQIMCRRLEEEKVIGLTKRIIEALSLIGAV